MKFELLHCYVITLAICNLLFVIYTYAIEMGQLVAAALLALLNNDIPIIVTEGAIVRGVIYFSIMPVITRNLIQ